MENNRENILVVDDTPENLRILTDLLTEQGYDVRPVPSGKLALEGAAAIIPDLILLDIHMPEMDGYEVCHHLKANEITMNVPVIFISALYETTDKVKAFETGGVDYIVKPFQIEEVLVRIQTHLKISKLEKYQNHLINELEEKNHQLTDALKEIKTLKGIIPICASCKKIRDDEGYWNQVESYIQQHSEAKFSHSICPECSDELYGEEDWYIEMKKKKSKNGN